MDKCWPAKATLKPMDFCLIISTQDISQTHLKTIKITIHIKKTKQNIVVLMLCLKHCGKEQWAFKKRSSVPWIVAHQ